MVRRQKGQKRNITKKETDYLFTFEEYETAYDLIKKITEYGDEYITDEIDIKIFEKF